MVERIASAESCPKTATYRSFRFLKMQPDAVGRRDFKLKIEVGSLPIRFLPTPSREHFAVHGFKQVPFSVTSRWFEGKCEIATYELDELLGTKLRALYQRKKGRDLFDLAIALLQDEVDPDRIVTTFATYMTFHVYKVTRAVAKTVVNFAVDAFGPDWIGNPNFRPILDFCLGRTGDPPGAPFVGPIQPPTGIRAIDECIPEHHALALSSNVSRVIGLVRLYGGTIYPAHLGQAPAGTEPFTKTVWIDYNGPGRVPVAPS